MAKLSITGFLELQKQIEGLTKRISSYDPEAFCGKAAKELAARLLAKVIKRTPVGRPPAFKGLGGSRIPKTLKVTSKDGKNRSFLSREGAILEQYWAGYVGGTLRRGWTAKTEAEAASGGEVDAVAYANSLPVSQSGETYTITIINPVNYASYVEFGHVQTPGRYVPQIGKRLKESWVSGKLMLTKSEVELRAQCPELLTAMLEKHLREVLLGQ